MTSLAESCPDLPDCVITRQLGNSQNNIRQHISPRKVNYGFSKKFETAEIHIFNYPETFKGMGKFLVCNPPLFYQIFMKYKVSVSVKLL